MEEMSEVWPESAYRLSTLCYDFCHVCHGNYGTLNEYLLVSVLVRKMCT